MGQSQVIELPTEISQRVLFCCRAANEREDRGEDEQACDLLAEFWNGPGTVPNVNNLATAETAQLLTRAGILTTKLGSKRQIEGWQELSKDLLSRAAEVADVAGDVDCWAEARKGLATCYWREGAFDEARLTLGDVLDREDLGRWRFTVSVDLAMVERSSGNPQKALEIYRSIADQVQSQSNFQQAIFHNGFALTLKATGRIDDALIEMTAAAYYFEEAGHQRYLILADINLGNLFALTKSFGEAHQHLDRAESLAKRLKDDLHLAQGKDSRALAFLAEGNLEAAEPAARESVAILERGDQYALLVDSLLTHGRVLSRLNDDKALGVYLRAYELAGARVGGERAGRIAREIIGELAGDACLRSRVTLDDVVSEFEASVIKRALDASAGKQREAAVRLGLKHQTLSLILHTRHKTLRPNPERKPRAKSIIKKR
jgi:tetratricopeptide (TPR) repeat protein